VYALAAVAFDHL